MPYLNKMVDLKVIKMMARNLQLVSKKEKRLRNFGGQNV
jgi:hypothetical protein